MSKFKKKSEGGIPAISTASLPDIVLMKKNSAPKEKEIAWHAVFEDTRVERAK